MTGIGGTPIPHAPGFVANDTPRVVTARFDYEDSYTLERYEATGGYQGLRKALERTPEEAVNLPGNFEPLNPVRAP